MSSLSVIAGGLLVLYLLSVIVRSFLKKEISKQILVYNCFLLSFSLSLLFLKFCWAPYLPENSPDWGFDPQRYYIYAIEFVNYGYYDGWVGSGFNGVVFFYAFIFFLFGYHPLIPLYVNVMLMLLSVLMLYEVFRNYSNIKLFYVALLLFIPDFVYFNVMSNKDTLCQYGLIFIFYFFYKYYTGRRIAYLLGLIVSIAFLMLIRLPYAACAIFAISVYLFLYAKNIKKSTKFFVLFFFVVIGLVGLRLTSALSSFDNTEEDWGERLDSYASGGTNVLEGGSTIAALLTPTNSIEVVVFGIIRMVVYLFPEGYYRFFSEPSTYTFGAITQLVAGILCTLSIGVVFRYIFDKFSRIHGNAALLSLFFLILLLMISFSTPNFVQQRYRIAFEMIYFMIAILAYCTYGKRKIANLVGRWSILGVGLLLVYIIKSFL